MPTVTEAFNQALQYHQAGNLQQAEQIYRQILAVDPRHADSHHLVGVAAYQKGQFAEAIASIRQAISINPWAAVYYANLGVSQEALGQLHEALNSYHHALRLDAHSAQANNAVGNAYRALGRLDDAIKFCAQALRLQPVFPEAHNNLANAFYLQGNYEKSIAHYQEALRQRPGYAEAHSNLGLSLVDSGKREEGMAHYYEAIRLNPNYAEPHNNLSIALMRESRFQEAEKHSRRALELKPNFVDAQNNLGSILVRQSRFQEGLAQYEHALSIRPNFAESHWNRALLWLLLGNLEEGWPAYEYRWTQPGFTRKHVDKPQWDGSILNGRAIVLHSEQGLGDTIQFIRYAPLLKQRGGRVIVECHPPLFRLLQGVPGIDDLISEGSPLPAFDTHAPLLSLPSVFRTTVATVPADVPYLHADSQLIEQWKKSPECNDGRAETETNSDSHTAHRRPHFLIGIAWQGTPAFRYDKQRSVPLAQLGRLAQIEGVRLVSLQKGPGTEQLPKEGGVQLHSDLALRTSHFALRTPLLDEASGPFMDTAAFIKNLDLVISSDTAVPHLAGALGVPVWVALALVPDWRWMLKREDCPWYPTMRLFRQTRFAQWEDVFERMAEELKALVGKRSG
jgi:tetratricopeptide (TPR) repeat protein